MADRVITKPRKKASRSVATHLERNVRAIAKLERSAMQERSPADRLSDGITWVAGSAGFVVAHAIGFTIWIAINVGLMPGVLPFDPYPFSFLTLVVSLEAIFLAIFVLMSQNRAAEKDRLAAEQDFQVNLKSELMLEELMRKSRGRDDQIEKIAAAVKEIAASAR